MDFSGKTALITGAGRGIGEACALQLARGGAQIVVNDLKAENLQELCQKLDQMNAAYLACPCDVADEAAVRAMVAKAIETFGKIDILVNNAGIFRAHYQPFKDQISAYWKQKIEINILGTMYCTHAVMPGMMERRYGRIINVSSVAGVYGLRNMVDYSMTKGAVIAFTKALAKELGPSGIRVNCVAPGVILTDMCAQVDPETLQELAEETPLGRNGKPEDVARAMEFLAQAEFITGHVLNVDGGFAI